MRIPTALVDCRVDRTAFDFQVRLSFSGLGPDEGYRVDADLVIETPFLLCDASGEWHELDPGTGSGLAPVLDLFRRTVSTVEIRGRGALHLTFDDGSELQVGPHAEYESWNLTGIGVDPITVGPGGETDWCLLPIVEPGLSRIT
ncbi:hypothetical protein Ais01nite_79380 [Asanoa ishikariensis]|uniref:Uncharacterized protein n=1 Tax=Asanoa ishikariensis TaxID=137265 RepID=A0A1H3UNI3_9ACTN|nr:DUF6188 family protein [Asanoa ishikariensis]GIF69903.1 hypothetical protein Ais01nite_79380 [Asanoa ishikariensis]SDZ63611.1 hypothetical protein SAMN05421684_7553 [Asanoa ishikariensis]